MLSLKGLLLILLTRGYFMFLLTLYHAFVESKHGVGCEHLALNLFHLVLSVFNVEDGRWSMRVRHLLVE